ncbi:MAG: hypothetical protein M1391_10595 [Bacteroidetes bacterium]|nr:hypothetical protein [Bacteroidota bacterium]
MSQFDDFWSLLKNNIANFAKENWNDVKDSAINDGNVFVNKAKEDLKKWTTQLADGKITADDFEWLLKGKKDLAELVLLKQKGLAKAALDKFTNGLMDTVVATAVKTFL